jgi:iron complex transport system ATP-binding protein
MIKIESLNVRIGSKEILSGINLEFHHGKWTCLVGPNGAGKTTLLRTILGAGEYAGSVTDQGVEVFNNHSRNVAFVPQHPNIPAGMSVAEYVMLGRAKRDGWGTESRSSKNLVSTTLKATGLFGAQNQLVSNLSGGEMQRALIAIFQIFELDTPRAPSFPEIMFCKSMFLLDSDIAA